MRHRTALATFLIAILAVAPAGAQGADRPPVPAGAAYPTPRLVRGQWVRATVRTTDARGIARHERVGGRLVRLDGDSLLLEDQNQIVAVPRAQLSSLDIPVAGTSRGHSAWNGAKVGGAAGAVGGALLGYLAWEPCDGEYFCMSRGDEAMLAGAVGGTLGFVIGGVVGATRSGARWRRVPLDADTRVGMIATPDGVGVAVRF